MVNVTCDYAMVRHLLRMWAKSRLRTKGISLKTERPRHIARQEGVCPICSGPLENDGKKTHVDHLRTVEDFARAIMAGEISFDAAYTQLWADSNTRAVCARCNYGRR